MYQSKLQLCSFVIHRLATRIHRLPAVCTLMCVFKCSFQENLCPPTSQQRFLSCVKFHMFVQMDFLGKSLSTNNTTERFLTSVDFHVCIQIVFSYKSLSTNITTERFLSRVDSHVCV
ncbi:hypothetical protein AMECASPLE_031360 [Ameca splendens]|uniref:Uncharacterized protein n=1 Tax=Ameca splendens TaxID=208324 RepID=A0ABV0Y678_9TELE